MTLDEANSYASSATVRVMVSFYPVATDDICSSSTRTSAIHKEKFNVPLSRDENDDLFNFVKHLKPFTGLAGIAKSKCLGGNPEVTVAISCSFIVTQVHKAISFLLEALTTLKNSKYQSKGPIYNLFISFCRN